MVIAAYMGDKVTFEASCNAYWRRFPDQQWLDELAVRSAAAGWSARHGSASDADVDAAFGLIVANRPMAGPEISTRTPPTLIGRIRGRLFLPNQCAGILLAGSDDGILKLRVRQSVVHPARVLPCVPA